MRRKLIIALILILVFGISGCGRNDNEQNQAESQFIPATNLHESMHGVNFQVPKEWDSHYDDPDFREYFEAGKDGKFKNGFIVFYTKEADPNELTNIVQSLELDERVHDITTSDAVIAGMPAKEVLYKQSMNGSEYKECIIYIEIEKATIIFISNSQTTTGYSDFLQVIDSITIKR